MLCPQSNCGQGLFPEDDGRRVQCPRIIGGCGVSDQLIPYTKKNSMPTCTFVSHCLATKVFLGKLLTTRGVWVINDLGGGGGGGHGPTNLAT